MGVVLYSFMKILCKWNTYYGKNYDGSMYMTEIRKRYVVFTGCLSIKHFPYL